MNYILKKNLYITKACKKEPLYIDKNDYIVMFDKPIKDFNLNFNYQYDYNKQIDKVNRNPSGKLCINYYWFEINVRNKDEYILSFDNFNRQCKLWINNKFVGYYNLSSRINLTLNEGKYLFLFEFCSQEASYDFVCWNIYSKKSVSKFLNYKLSNYYSDIRVFYLIYNNNSLAENEKTFNFMLLSDYIDNYYTKTAVKILIEKIVKNDFIAIDEFSSYLGEKFEYNVENLPFGEYLISIKDSTPLKSYNFYIGGVNKIYDLLFKEVEEKLQKNQDNSDVYNIHLSKIKNSTAPISGKYYLLKRLRTLINSSTSSESKNELIAGFNQVTYSSIYKQHGSMYYLFLNEIDNYKKERLVILLSRDNSSTYLQYVSKFCQDGDIFLECSINSTSFGNVIVEKSVFECIQHFFETYKYNVKQIFLVGYSACGSAALMFASRFPNIFDGVLSFGGECNSTLLKNCVNMKVWNIVGSSDIKKDRILKSFSEVTRYKANIKAIIIPNYNHASILDFYQRTNIFEIFFKKIKLNKYKIIYYFDIPYYGYYQDIKVIKQEKPFAISKIVFKKVLKIKKIYNVKRYIQSKINSKDYFIKGHSLDNENWDEINSNNGLGLYNIYRDNLKIICHNNEEFSYINKFINPQNMSDAPDFNIYNETMLKKDVSINTLKKHNCIIFNYYNLREEDNILNMSDKKIVCSNDGYKLKNESYLGSYVIAQMYYFNEFDRSILYIDTNELEMMKKCFFINRFFIATDLNNRPQFCKYNTFIYNINGYFCLSNEGELESLI